MANFNLINSKDANLDSGCINSHFRKDKKLKEKNCVSDQTFSLTEGPSDDRRTCSGDPDPAPGDHDPCPDGSGSWGYNGTSPDPHSQQCGGGEEWDIPHTGQWSTGEETHYCLIWEFSFLLWINILTCILAVNLHAKLIASSKALVIIKSLYFEESQKKGKKKCLGVNSLKQILKSNESAKHFAEAIKQSI